MSSRVQVLGVLNAGSSSIKFAVYRAEPSLPLMFRGAVRAIGVAPRIALSDATGTLIQEREFPTVGFDHAAGTREIVVAVESQLGKGAIAAVGHRIVHGGITHSQPQLVDAALIGDLERLVPLAPLHQPHNLAPIKAIVAVSPDRPQVACFDTAFHTCQPMIGRLFALPREYTDAGVLRYGFHGLSYEYVSRRLRELAPELAAGRVVVAHLGNGSSLCAMNDGRSVATTMGFTAVEGLMMGTRCGSIDPGVLVYMMDQHQMGPRELEDLIYKRSGLLGVSGISSDMRELRSSSEPAAANAISLYVYRVVREIGSMAAALGGLDGLVFTAGIGENDAATRAQVVAGCAWLGMELDDGRNATARSGLVSRDGSRAQAWIVPTDEERMIAEHTLALLK